MCILSAVFQLRVFLYLLCAFVILPVIKIIIYLHTYLHKRSFIVRSLFNFTWLMCVVYFICSFQLRALLYVLCAFVILNKDYLLTYFQQTGMKRRTMCIVAFKLVVLRPRCYHCNQKGRQPWNVASYSCSNYQKTKNATAGAICIFWGILSESFCCNFISKTENSVDVGLLFWIICFFCKFRISLTHVFIKQL